MSKFKRQQGSVAVLIAILVLSGMLVISFAVSTLITKQIKLSITSADSTIAYQAADSGIERSYYALNEDATTTSLFLSSVEINANQVCSGSTPYWFSIGSASFCLDTFQDISGHLTGLKSIGKYKNTRRAIQIGSNP